MAIRKIRLDEDPILRKVSREVKEVNDKIKILVEDMIETMHAEEGVGLSAVQVGVLRRVITYDLYDEKGPRVIINPEISEFDEKCADTEGCLSLPGKLIEVERPKCLRVQGYDLNFDKIDKRVCDLEARVICHELDHLNGILIVDYEKKELPGD